MKIDKIIKEEIENLNNSLTLYHGTSLENGTRLIEFGWKPSNGKTGGNMGQSRYLYLTSDPEDAMWFANEMGENFIVEVSNIPITYLRPDPEDEAGYTMAELLDMMKSTKLPSKFVLTKELGAEHFKKL